MRFTTPSCGLAAVLAIASAAMAATIVKEPYLQNLTTDGVTVMWETDQPTSGRVVYGPKGRLTRQAGAAESRRIQEVRLTGLQAETEYEYRVEAGSAKAGPFAFRTAVKPESAYRFAVYGDNRSNPKAHAAVVAGMARHKPGFVVNTGDLVGNGNNYEEWGPQFFAPLAPLTRHVPIYPALGNHEGNGKLYCEFFSLPAPEWYYAFTYGNAKFVIVDSTPRRRGWFAPDSDQGRWLARTLQDKGHTWTFAAYHHPPYSSHPRRGHSETHRRALGPPMEKNRVDVVFNGHNHYYERVFPMRGDDRDDANGVHYVITGGGGAPTYPALKDWFTAAHESIHHYCIVEVDGPLMSLTAYAVDGHVIDRFGLCKDVGVLERIAAKARAATGSERTKAVDQLSTIFSARMPEILASFAGDEDVTVRRAVAAGLGRLAMADGRATAAKMIADSDAEVRRGAALAVARTSKAGDADVIARLIKDPDPGVRRSAAWFFVHVQGPDVIPHVLAAMDDPDAAVRRLAIRGVGSAKGESVLPVLAKAVCDPDPDVAMPALNSVTRNRLARKLIDPLLKAAVHKDASVRHVAIRAIIPTGQRNRIIPVLVESVDDPDPKVQGYVVGTLERWTKKSFGYDKAKWKKWLAERK